MPAHGLLTALPNGEDLFVVRPEHSFYTTKNIAGEKGDDILFSPLVGTKLLNASIECIAQDRRIIYKDNLGFWDSHEILKGEELLKDYSLLFGIRIEDMLLEKVQELSLCILPNYSETYPYVRMVEFFDLEGNLLRKNEMKKDYVFAHYEEEILSYYEDFLYNINVEKALKEKKTIADLFPNAVTNLNGEEPQESLFWIKIKFPEFFSRERLDDISLTLNTFPVVNRKVIEGQHNVKKNGRIIPLVNDKKSYFLTMKSLIDDMGESYEDIVKTNEKSKEGTYSVYFGDLDKFDDRSARVILNKAIQSVREEGSAFNPMGIDYIETGLKELHKALISLEKKRDISDYDFYTSDNRAYLLTHPREGIYNYELEYWITNAEYANGLTPQNHFFQYRTDVFVPDSIRLVTETVGGDLRRSDVDRINSLRYGLLSRERIVSEQDIRSFITKYFNSFLEEISIGDGVGISSDPLKGLIRVTEINVKLNVQLSDDNRGKLENFLEKELVKRSLRNVYYKLNIK